MADDAYLAYSRNPPKEDELLKCLKEYGLSNIQFYDEDRDSDETDGGLSQDGFATAEEEEEDDDDDDDDDDRYERRCLNYDCPSEFDIADSVTAHIDKKTNTVTLLYLERPTFGEEWMLELIFELMKRFGFALVYMACDAIYVAEGHPPSDESAEAIEHFPQGIKFIKSLSDVFTEAGAT